MSQRRRSSQHKLYLYEGYVFISATCSCKTYVLLEHFRSWKYWKDHWRQTCFTNGKEHKYPRHSWKIIKRWIDNWNIGQLMLWLFNASKLISVNFLVAVILVICCAPRVMLPWEFLWPSCWKVLFRHSFLIWFKLHRNVSKFNTL